MNKWMKIAHAEAVKGMLAGDGGPFGAVIVKDNEMIAAGHNMVLKSNDPTEHAEVNVIRKASQKLGAFDLSKCEIYVSCMPCPMCLGAIFWARIPIVYYGATEHDASRGGFDDHRFYEMIKGNNSDITFTQIDYDENARLFDLWLEKEDRILY
ncbi:MAG TPA: nucleoside deaminase [Gammaproteobacteria bacterium]|nr:nucleoside deaminase [Gammaproteobacteria bacterium]